MQEGNGAGRGFAAESFNLPNAFMCVSAFADLSHLRFFIAYLRVVCMEKQKFYILDALYTFNIK